jgi:two-component system, OmpR family, response regulator VicR
MNMKALAKVLLVDDEPEFVAILTQRLTKRNYSVTFAHSGKDALARLEEDKGIEVVILDVKMPGFNGIETLKLIRKKWPLIEVIMLTGHSTLNSAINTIKLGAYDFLLKPIEINKLVSKIEEAAGRKRDRDRLILEVYMTPYLTRRERKEKIAKILGPDSTSSETRVISHEES